MLSPDPSHYDHIKPSFYFDIYREALARFIEKDIRLLEMGVYRGGSLRFWKDYFPHGIIVGIDENAVAVNDLSGRLRVFQGKQQDTSFLDNVAQEVAPDGFDIIIDDASHIGAHARTAFWHLFPSHLKPGGVYAIEDWTTGYWANWADGELYQGRAALDSAESDPLTRQFPSHDYGMVGFVKELVDEFAQVDEHGSGSIIAKLLFQGTIVLAFKAKE